MTSGSMGTTAFVRTISSYRSSGSPERAHPLKSGAAKRQIYRGFTATMAALPNDS